MITFLWVVLVVSVSIAGLTMVFVIAITEWPDSGKSYYALLLLVPVFVAAWLTCLAAEVSGVLLLVTGVLGLALIALGMWSTVRNFRKSNSR